MLHISIRIYIHVLHIQGRHEPSKNEHILLEIVKSVKGARGFLKPFKHLSC